MPDETTALTVDGRTLPLELFLPPGGGPHPGVVVLSELYGVNDDMRRIARRFADSGYVAALPDYLATGRRLGCIARAMRSLSAGEGRTVAEIEAAVGALEQRADVGRVGVAGFCMGGGFALLLGCRRRVGAAAVFYGETRPRDELAQACPLVGGYGGKDPTFGKKGRRLVADLDELGKEHDVRVYPQAGHSYMNRAAGPLARIATRPILAMGHDEEAAEDSWRRMLDFFGTHLA